MLELKLDKMALYKATAQKRERQEAAVLQQRYVRAQHVAQQAATLLKTRYKADRVMVFGSLVHKTLFHRRSDIDLAVWNLDERDYYRAIGELQALDPTFAIDLVRVEDASPTLRATIEQEGLPL